MNRPSRLWARLLAVVLIAGAAVVLLGAAPASKVEVLSSTRLGGYTEDLAYVTTGPLATNLVIIEGYEIWGIPGQATGKAKLRRLFDLYQPDPAPTPIIRNGKEWYHQFGTEKSRGTKVFTMLGNVNFTGAIEVPLGITIREVIDIYGKGMKRGARLKMVQTGGSSGSIVPASLQDTPLDFESGRKAGVSLGSGALLICDETYLCGGLRPNDPAILPP